MPPLEASQPVEGSLLIYTVGHSNRDLAAFLALLKEFRVNLLVDIRRFPTSKWDWFRRENLHSALEGEGIRYEYLGDVLGGFRKGGYPKYMATPEFQRGVEALVKLARGDTVAVMCAERIVFKCHRRYVARHLQQRGFRVIHIVDSGKSFESRAVHSTS